MQFNAINNNGKVMIIDWAFAGIMPYSLDIARLISHGSENYFPFPFYMTDEYRKLFINEVYAKLTYKLDYRQYIFDITLSCLNECIEFIENELNDPTAERDEVFDYYYKNAKRLADIILKGSGNMIIDNYQKSEKIKIEPLTIDELRNIKNITYIDKSALTSEVLGAIDKKIKKMEAVPREMHQWYTYWVIKNKENIGVGFIGAKGLVNDKTIEIGYNLSLNYRRRGIMTKALEKFINFAFESNECNKIIAKVLPSNEPSLKVLAKFNFKEIKEENGYKILVLTKI